jgi:phosphate:Na+ symporter
VLKCAAVGCILTFIVQSSSATLGITIGLAQIGVIPFETAAALVLGENIGTTITAWLASFGTTTNAKRAAYAHVAFNLLGVAWITAVFPWYISLIKLFIAGSPTADVSAEVTAAIAATHTGFNVTNTLLFLPLAGVLAKVLIKVIPERAVKEEPHLTNLDVRILESPVLAIEQSRVEVLRMADGCNKMMGWLGEILASDAPDPETVQKTIDEEDSIDTVQDEIVSFMTSLLASNIPENLIDEARRQLRMADEYESVSDYIGRILKYHVRLHELGLKYEEPEREHLLKLHEMVASYLESVTKSYHRWDKALMDAADARGRNISQEVRDLRHEIMDRMAQNGMPPRISVTYNRQINAYRRVRDHAVNIAEAITGVK